MQTAADTQNVARSKSCLVCTCQRAYCWLTRGASLLQSPILLIMRLYWGWQFFGTGRGKLMNHEKVAGFFQSLDIPFPGFNAYLAGTTECIGGLLLLIGLGSRLVSLPLIFLLFIAYITAESDSLKSVFSDPDKFTSATPFLFLVACVIVLAFGPGKFSADWVLSKLMAKRKSQGEI